MISSKRGDYGLSDVSVQVSQLSDSEQLSKEELVEYFFQYIKDKEAKEKEKANKFDTESLRNNNFLRIAGFSRESSMYIKGRLWS